MKIAYDILAVLLAIQLVLSARMKLTRDPKAVEIIHETVKVPLRYFALLAGLEIAGGVGVFVGIWVKFLGIAAAIGVILYMLGAILAHIRVSDYVLKNLFPAIMLLIFAVVVLVLRLAT